MDLNNGGVMNNSQRQQGDVIYRRVDSLPKGAVEVPRKGGIIVVMHGENGHTHMVAEVDALFFEKEGKFYLKNSKTVTLTHEEHNHQTVEPGIWEIGQVREKDWLNGMVRKVID